MKKLILTLLSLSSLSAFADVPPPPPPRETLLNVNASCVFLKQGRPTTATLRSTIVQQRCLGCKPQTKLTIRNLDRVARLPIRVEQAKKLQALVNSSPAVVRKGRTGTAITGPDFLVTRNSLDGRTRLSATLGGESLNLDLKCSSWTERATQL